MTRKEKRKFQRKEYSFEVTVSILDRKNNIDGQKIKAESINASANGILFNCGENLKIGTFLILTFFPSTNSPEIIVEAKVVRSKKKKDSIYAIAVHFTEYEKGDEQELNSLLFNAQ
jgi:c-di-GMP-binding flagellar brake protein YcgR